MSAAFSIGCPCPCNPCARYWIRTASRSWCGATFLNRHFLTFHERLDSGFFTPGEFTLQWDITRGDSYGSFTTLGTVGSNISAADVFIRPADAAQFASQAGAYSFLVPRVGDGLANLIDFTPEANYSVRFHYDNSNFDLVREWSNEFIVSALTDILTADLEDLRPSFIDDDVNSPTFGAAEFMNANAMPSDPRGFSGGGQRTIGGFYDQCEISDGRIYGGSGLDPSLGFACRSINLPDFNQNHSLRKASVYIGGDHRITTHEMRAAGGAPDQTAPAIACQNITIPSLGVYEIDPPETNARWLMFGENLSCA